MQIFQVSTNVLAALVTVSPISSFGRAADLQADGRGFEPQFEALLQRVVRNNAGRPEKYSIKIITAQDLSKIDNREACFKYLNMKLF